VRRYLVIVGVAVVVAGLVAVLVIPPRLRRERVLAGLRDPSPAVRLAAVRALDPDSDVGLLLEALKDEDPDVRLVTAGRVGGEGPHAERRVAGLIEALKDRHAGVRRAAADSLWSLGPASGPALTAALKDPDPRVRAEAAWALQTWQHKEKRERAPGEVEAIRPLLKDLLNDEDATVRRNAEMTLDTLR